MVYLESFNGLSSQEGANGGQTALGCAVLGEGKFTLVWFADREFGEVQVVLGNLQQSSRG